MAPELLMRAIRKASSSICRFKISAMAFDKRGKLLGTSFNRPRFSKKGGSIHAEMELMAQYGTNIKTIIICRTDGKEGLLPIDPCVICKAKADELGIKIKSIMP
jgi:hypothetical protein